MKSCNLKPAFCIMHSELKTVPKGKKFQKRPTNRTSFHNPIFSGRPTSQVHEPVMLLLQIFGNKKYEGVITSNTIVLITILRKTKTATNSILFILCIYN
jgi:hypothetical protein